jgi:hypothetical protein
MPRRSPSSSPNSPQRRTTAPAIRPGCDEAAGVALLRRTADGSDSLEVHWPGGLALSLSVDNRPVLAGPWELEVLADGQPVPLPQTLECVLWHSDKDCDYLELQAPLAGGVLEYQVLLARQDRYAHLAVKVTGLNCQEIAVTQRWTLSPAVTAAAETESREITLRDASAKPVNKIRAFPLSLAQDRWLSSPGQFVAAEWKLELRHIGPGGGAFVPLYLDWNPVRRRAPADWRTLTVAQEGHRLRPDQAAGHRIRIGLEHHLLIYHALEKSDVGRSVLGYNTRRETLIGLFSDCGNVDAIMGVES